MRFGLQIVRYNQPSIPDALSATAYMAEKADLSSLWVMDHLQQVPYFGSESDPMLEAYTTLGYLAARTSKIRLGAMVSNATLRHPALLAKAATTLDVLSEGRAYLGIGAGWYTAEDWNYDVHIRERWEQFRCALRTVYKMRNGDHSSTFGVRYSPQKPYNFPRPVGALPIIVGGRGREFTLTWAAAYADGYNFLHRDPDQVQASIEKLKEFLDAEMRDVDAFEFTLTWPMQTPMTPIRLGVKMEELAEAYQPIGIDQIIFSIPDAHTDKLWRTVNYPITGWERRA